MNCDVLDLSKADGAPVSCGDATDAGEGHAICTSSTYAGLGDKLFENQTCYRGDDKVFGCVSFAPHEFFCCRPARL